MRGWPWGSFAWSNEATAKKCVPLFVQELGRATNPAVRPVEKLTPPLQATPHIFMQRKLRNNKMVAMQFLGM